MTDCLAEGCESEGGYGRTSGSSRGNMVAKRAKRIGQVRCKPRARTCFPCKRPYRRQRRKFTYSTKEAGVRCGRVKKAKVRRDALNGFESSESGDCIEQRRACSSHESCKIIYLNVWYWISTYDDADEMKRIQFEMRRAHLTMAF